MVQLYYDERDHNEYFLSRGEQRLYWLDDLGAKPITAAQPKSQGYLFAGARSVEDYKSLTRRLVNIKDSVDERFQLLSLSSVLQQLRQKNVDIPMAKTWELHIDEPLPQHICYPLFVRTDRTSWKLGGKISYVKDEEMLLEECELLRRAFGWDAKILAREWLELAEAGTFRMGSLPQEVRVWIVDAQVFAWSFHHMLVVKDPKGFPLTTEDKTIIFNYASQIGKSFTSRLIVADFAKLKNGKWTFIEAGPGSCAGTGHEEVFKAVACELLGHKYAFTGNKIGGLFTEGYEAALL